MRNRTASVLLLFAWIPAAIPAAGQMPARLVELHRFGCADCEGPLLFTSILAIDADGEEVLVLDAEPPFLRVFTRAGTPLRALGSRGEGPGEMRAPFGAAFVGDGAVEAFDIRLLRRVRFDRAGRLADTRVVPRSTFPTAVARVDRAWLVAGTDFRESTRLYRFEDGRESPDTLFTFDRDFPGSDGPLPPMLASIFAAPDGSAFVQSDGSDYRIRRYGPDGRLRVEYSREVPRTMRSEEEIRTLQQRYGRMAGRLREMGAAEGARDIAQRPVPAERPHFTAHALALDAAGRLWVRTERGGMDVTIFDLFAPDGAWLGEVRLDAPLGRFLIQDSELIGVSRDVDETPQVVRWRIAAGT